jgi:hypothetical protein
LLRFNSASKEYTYICLIHIPRSPVIIIIIIIIIIININIITVVTIITSNKHKNTLSVAFSPRPSDRRFSAKIVPTLADRRLLRGEHGESLKP